jgi:hypothetical protein
MLRCTVPLRRLDPGLLLTPIAEFDRGPAAVHQDKPPPAGVHRRYSPASS